MGHFTYWRYSRPVSANFSTRSPPIGDFCSVRSSLGIPFGSRNWRVGSGCSFSPASGCGKMSFQRLLTQHTSEAMHVQRNDGQSNTSGKSLSTFRPCSVERSEGICPKCCFGCRCPERASPRTCAASASAGTISSRSLRQAKTNSLLQPANCGNQRVFPTMIKPSRNRRSERIGSRS